LSTEARRTLLHELTEDTDVVLASYRPDTAEALGADYETLSSVNPDLVYGHVTGYSPDRERAGYDAVIQAESGFMHMNGTADGPPTKLPVALVDVLAAHQLKEGLLAALLRREQGGGAYVPVSLLQSAVSGLANQVTNWLVAGHRPQRMGSAHPNIAPYGTSFPTASRSSWRWAPTASLRRCAIFSGARIRPTTRDSRQTNSAWHTAMRCMPCWRTGSDGSTTTPCWRTSTSAAYQSEQCTTFPPSSNSPRRRRWF
jgi:Predicted acyl-CoA transferases/carnitine dehydratase